MMISGFREERREIRVDIVAVDAGVFSMEAVRAPRAAQTYVSRRELECESSIPQY